MASVEAVTEVQTDLGALISDLREEGLDNLADQAEAINGKVGALTGDGQATSPAAQFATQSPQDAPVGGVTPAGTTEPAPDRPIGDQPVEEQPVEETPASDPSTGADVTQPPAPDGGTPEGDVTQPPVEELPPGEEPPPSA